MGPRAVPICIGFQQRQPGHVRLYQKSYSKCPERQFQHIIRRGGGLWTHHHRDRLNRWHQGHERFDGNCKCFFSLFPRTVLHRTFGPRSSSHLRYDTSPDPAVLRINIYSNYWALIVPLRPPAHALSAPFPTSEMPSFALDLQATSLDAPASIEFGGIDHSRYVGQLASAPLNSTSGHWTVDNVDFSVGDVRMNVGTSSILGAYPSLDDGPRSNDRFHSLQTRAQDTTFSSRQQSLKPTIAKCPEPCTVIFCTMGFPCGRHLPRSEL